MFVVIVEFEIKPEFIEAFRERVCRQASDSLTLEADCHVFDVCLDPDNAAGVLLYEVYSERSAFDAHLATAHFVDFDAEVASWLINKTVRFYDRI